MIAEKDIIWELCFRLSSVFGAFKKKQHFFSLFVLFFYWEQLVFCRNSNELLQYLT